MKKSKTLTSSDHVVLCGGVTREMMINEILEMQNSLQKFKESEFIKCRYYATRRLENQMEYFELALKEFL